MNWCSGSWKLHLQGGDSIIVQRGHLLLRQGVSCLVVDLKPCVELQHVQQLQDDIRKRSACRLGVSSHRRPGGQGGQFYLAEEVSLLLPGGKVGQVAVDHQVRVVQERVEPAPGGQQSLDAHSDTVIVSEPKQNRRATVQVVPDIVTLFCRLNYLVFICFFLCLDTL